MNSMSNMIANPNPLPKDKLSNLVKRIKLKRQTKLICTLDEKWNNTENITKLLKSGVDAVEIYSELNEDVKRELIEKVKTYAKENLQYIPIIYNLSYYRIYVSQINQNDDVETFINQNQTLYITNNKKNFELVEGVIKAKELEIKEEMDGLRIVDGDEEETNTHNTESKNVLKENSFNNNFNNAIIEQEQDAYDEKSTIILSEPVLNFKNFLKTDIIHINYGEVSLKIEDAEEDYLKCVAMNSGMIQKFNSLSVEGKEHFTNDLIVDDQTKLNMEIESATKLGVEFIVMSIVDEPVKEIKYIKELAKNVNIVVKIDNPKSIQNIDEYVGLADAIYFSRSDLNLKDSLSKICFYQKSIVSKCGYLGVPVIIAGTFLDTMRTLPNPIRAEISDLYNTILQGIDCLLLTAEIISGNYPYEVVETINEICASCEKRVDYSNLFLEILYKTQKPMKIVEAVASSTVKTSFNLQTPFIVCVTEKGTASKMVSKYRPYCPVISITSKPAIAHALSIFRGIFSMIYEDTYNTDAVITHSNEFLVKSKLITTRSNIVLLSGLNEKKNGTTDQMRVITIEKL